jgi:hypothetical protein
MSIAIIPSAVVLNVVATAKYTAVESMLSVGFYCYAECHYTECRCAECCGASQIFSCWVNWLENIPPTLFYFQKQTKTYQ